MRSGSKKVLVVVAAAAIMSAALGIRQCFGLFVDPFASARGLPVSLVAFAIALHNVVWGMTQPAAGAAADRWGAAPVVAVGAVVLATGLGLAALAQSAAMLAVGMGLMVGIGVSCTTFGVVLPAVGRAVSPARRSAAMGLATAGGSVGMVALVPLAQGVTAASGIAAALVVLALAMLAVAPFGLLLGGGTPAGPTEAAPPLRAVLAQAFGDRGYRLMTLGFFTCGFQLGFIATYLPGYLSLCQMPAGLGATALALIGLFNMAGSWGCGWLGGRYRQQDLLGWLYLIRAATIAAFFLAPKSPAVVVAFAAVMGLTWLGTVPLTGGWVAKVFGTRHLGTLFGFCFLSHQLGSFLGAWAGGIVFDLTGSYAPVWIGTAAAGLLAALLNFPIKDRAPCAAEASA